MASKINFPDPDQWVPGKFPDPDEWQGAMVPETLTGLSIPDTFGITPEPLSTFAGYPMQRGGRPEQIPTTIGAAPKGAEFAEPTREMTAEERAATALTAEKYIASGKLEEDIAVAKATDTGWDKFQTGFSVGLAKGMSGGYLDPSEYLERTGDPNAMGIGYLTGIAMPFKGIHAGLRAIPAIGKGMGALSRAIPAMGVPAETGAVFGVHGGLRKPEPGERRISNIAKETALGVLMGMPFGGLGQIMKAPAKIPLMPEKVEAPRPAGIKSEIIPKERIPTERVPILDELLGVEKPKAPKVPIIPEAPTPTKQFQRIKIPAEVDKWIGNKGSRSRAAIYEYARRGNRDMAVREYRDAESGLYGGDRRSKMASDAAIDEFLDRISKVEKPVAKPKVEPVGAKRAAKEPWEMTREEYLRRTTDDRGRAIPKEEIESFINFEDVSTPNRAYLVNAYRKHAFETKHAINTNKPVPAEVLADYPELKSQVATPKAKPKVNEPTPITITVKDVTRKGNVVGVLPSGHHITIEPRPGAKAFAVRLYKFDLDRPLQTRSFPTKQEAVDFANTLDLRKLDWDYKPSTRNDYLTLDDLAKPKAPPTRVAVAETEVAKVKDVSIDQIRTDVDRFQNRFAEFNEETARHIAERYNPNSFDPIVLWKDSSTGQDFVVSGHSRLEGVKRHGETKVLARYFEGTEAEARNFATIEANRLQTKETLAESVRAYTKAKKAGYAKAKMKDLFGADLNALEAIQHLDQKGKFIEILSQPNIITEFPFIKRFATWVGQLRGEYGVKLKGRHEGQLFDFLYKEGRKNIDIGKDDFFNLVQKNVDRMDWTPNQPLVLKRGEMPAAGTRAREDTGWIENKIDDLKALKEEARTVEERTVLDQEITKLSSGIQDIVKSQADIFAMGEAGAIKMPVDIKARNKAVISVLESIRDERTPYLKEYIRKYPNTDISDYVDVKMINESIRNRIRLPEEVERIQVEGAEIPVLKGQQRLFEEPTGIIEGAKPIKEKPMQRDIFGESGFIGMLMGEKFPKRPALYKPGEFEVGKIEVPEIMADIGITSKVQTPAHLLGAYPGTKPKYGKAAAQAQRKLLFTERDMKVEVGRRSDEIRAIRKSIPREDFGKTGDQFIEIFNGKPIDEILARTDIKPATKQAAKKLRDYFERDRQEIISRRREQISPMATKAAEAEYRMEHGLYGKRVRGAKDKAFEAKHIEGIRQATEEKIKGLVPEDWGIRDYFPQIHPGDYRIEYKGKYITSAGNKGQVQEAILDHGADLRKTGIKPDAADYNVTRRDFHDPDVVRVSTGRYWKILNDLGKASEVSQKDIAGVLRGKIGRREAKQKWGFFLQKRKGALGYSQDFKQVMEIYNRSYTRWKHLTDLNKEFQPLLQQIRAEGRTGVAEYLEANFRQLWGQKTELSKIFDASMQKIPGVKNHIRPFALDRWLGMVKSGFTTMVLKLNPRFHMLNRAQTWQTLAPLIDRKTWIEGHRLYHSPEGRALLNKYGVRYLTGGKIAEGQRAKTRPATREKMRGFAPETYNQEMAWTTMYSKARKMGLSEAEAADYGFLAGNVRSQFAYLRSDMPAAFRGPVPSTIFMYKRFPIKAIELGSDLLRSKHYSGFARFIGTQLLLGGAKLATGLVPKVTGIGYISWKVYNQIKDEYGETAANAIAFGVPGFLGMDWSYSVQFLDLPYGEGIAEKIGNVALGPPGQVGVRVGRAVFDTKGPEDRSAFERAMRRLSQSFPGTRWIESLEMVLEGDYNFKDPAGRVKFKGDLVDVLKNALGARSSKAGIDDMFIEALMQVKEGRDKSLDGIVAKVLNDKFDEANQLIAQWNELWPDFPILSNDIETRAMRRYQDKDLTRVERFLKQSGKAFRASEQFQVPREKPEEDIMSVLGL